MSAKTGDNVLQCFYRVAADLAGVTLTKPEIEVRYGPFHRVHYQKPGHGIP